MTTLKLAWIQTLFAIAVCFVEYRVALGWFITKVTERYICMWNNNGFTCCAILVASMTIIVMAEYVTVSVNVCYIRVLWVLCDNLIT